MPFYSIAAAILVATYFWWTDLDHIDEWEDDRVKGESKVGTSLRDFSKSWRDSHVIKPWLNPKKWKRSVDEVIVEAWIATEDPL